MRAVLQRVSRAQVSVAGNVVGAIQSGYLALIGIERGDGAADVAYLARKIAGLRLFSDAEGKMNRPLSPASDAVLAISQFTLMGDTRRGMRPSFDTAAPPAQAKPLFEAVVEALRREGLHVETGIFQADMRVESMNEGPVTVLLESRMAPHRTVAEMPQRVPAKSL
ncbi:MAG TPA: D-aminoacyl-tRNA deacylase [Terriglobales bacterium]|nr:D-aminoacyl-tRNA deacylase [Terriglobales bacterium]